MDYLELIGWIGNVFVVISFLNNDTLKLRSYNLVGASLWLVYGIVAGSFSIIFLNVVVISIQIVKITQILRERKKNHSLFISTQNGKIFFLSYLKNGVKSNSPSFK